MIWGGSNQQRSVQQRLIHDVTSDNDCGGTFICAMPPLHRSAQQAVRKTCHTSGERQPPETCSSSSAETFRLCLPPDPYTTHRFPHLTRPRRSQSSRPAAMEMAASLAAVVFSTTMPAIMANLTSRIPLPALQPPRVRLSSECAAHSDFRAISKAGFSQGANVSGRCSRSLASSVVSTHFQSAISAGSGSG